MYQDLTTTLFRIFQEALTNIIRHAGATQVTVDLKEADGRITLDLKDNGRGIAKTEISDPKSMGLLGMRERATLMGGEFKIARLPRGKGTRVTVSIPLLQHSTTPGELDEDSLSRRPRRTPPLE